MTTTRYAKPEHQPGNPLYGILRRLGLFGPLRRLFHSVRERHLGKSLAGRTTLSERALTKCQQENISRLRDLTPYGPLGDYLEFGVCPGSSMACMHDALRAMGERGPRLYGFDSFEDRPGTAAGGHRNGPGHRPRSPLRITRDRLTRRGIDWSRTHLIKGRFDQTLTRRTARRHGIEQAGMIMVDCILHSPASRVLAFCAPLIREHAVVILANWNVPDLAEPDPGERAAFEAFMADHPEFAGAELPSYRRDAAVFLVSRRASP